MFFLDAAHLFQSRLEEFTQVETLDSGKPIWEARYDIQGCSDTLDYYGGLAAGISGKHYASTPKQYITKTRPCNIL